MFIQGNDDEHNTHCGDMGERKQSPTIYEWGEHYPLATTTTVETNDRVK